MTRKEAIAAGVERYFTGKPCPKGHVAMRRVSGACCECAKLMKQRYCKANPLKVKTWKSANQKLHRDSANARNRKYAAANHEKLRDKNLVWEKANPGKVLAKAAKRRAAKLRAIPLWADQDAINRIYERAQTFRVTGQDVHVDHIVPLQGKTVCGLHVHDNLQIIDAQANWSKSNSLVGGL